jgi:hypothetical protein
MFGSGLGQRIHNGDELNMYLLDFEADGTIKKFMKVAGQYKAPNDYIYSKSEYYNKSLIRTTIKRFADIDNSDHQYQDSITEIVNLDNFSIVKYDSVRVK